MQLPTAQGCCGAYTSLWYVGSGIYDSVAGTFTGSMKCDPAVYGAAACNTLQDAANGSYVFCGGNTFCAFYGTYHSNIGGGYGYGAKATVTAIPVTSVTQQW